jgi:hypothetical protein
MTQDRTEHVPMSASELLASLKQSYPAYYKAWRSMISNNPVALVTKEWRGAAGFAAFINDTSLLPNNPNEVSGVKIKRKIAALPFSPSNVYWKLPAKVLVSSQSIYCVQDIVAESRAAQKQQVTVDSLAALPKEEQEARFNTLMEAQFSGTTLTVTESAELDVLGKLLSGEDIPIPPASKYEDI